MHNTSAKDDTPLIINGHQESLEQWADNNKQIITNKLIQHKAVLFRNFSNREGLNSISKCFFSELLDYNYRSTSRTLLSENVYTSTEYPQNLTIQQHCENSYQTNWPLKLLFHCVTPATKGGQTPICDMINVTEAIDNEIKREFEQKKVMYVRNFRKGADLPWQEVFNTTEKAHVEAYCQSHNIEFQWIGDDLKTRHISQATATHPITQQKIWFNQAHLFHITAWEKPYRQVLLSHFTEEGLPRNTYFGDGSPIPPETLDHIRSAFDQNITFFDWEKDDVLLLDNMLVSHGRTPYEGDRKVTVCMTEAYSPQDN
ncbi:TauD/TfdA family dioxygenase [Endozoicomonas sp. SM1973]|uniref:TauD/TfdA family dioxygenase n=1 Tax=Spartinivicinus marinus TaxID=2994442 RepID=A0A853IHX0_9GAMM|nr:TauD/TfdA family dioxygenase [Spartinivicinus marinus]MCX4030109.1 TauD/TfdA family dioxygenase [Spartinivicinus marinus]NYZ69651.1 TauD/TfdA family dioxygenase [Spartinivicinus marinus]